MNEQPLVSVCDLKISDDGRTLKISGWKLTTAPRYTLTVKDARGCVLEGTFQFDVPRNDIAAQFPQFGDANAGWELTCTYDEHQQLSVLTVELTANAIKVRDTRHFSSSEPSQVIISSARFFPNLRLIIAEGSIPRQASLQSLSLASSMGRMYAPCHLSLTEASASRQFWRFEGRCTGIKDNEELIATLQHNDEHLSTRYTIVMDEETQAFLKLGHQAQLKTNTVRIVDAASAKAFARMDMLTSFPMPDTSTAVFFPPFESTADLTNHFHRAAWYLAGRTSPIQRIIFGIESPNVRVGVKPSYFCAPQAQTDGMVLLEADEAYIEALNRAGLIFVWQPLPGPARAYLKKKVPEAQIFTVATDDLESTEYGNYAKALWAILSEEDRETHLRISYARFIEALEAAKQRGKTAAAVFGTGPSIEKAFDYDFSSCLTIACNTAVADEELLDHLQPSFLCAGDVVSHFGVSSYAERFRTDLIKALKCRDMLFFTSAPFGFLLSVKYPEIAHKIIMCEQRQFGVNTDLRNIWVLPRLDSTLNIHMLPIASTFSEYIFILGCDGKNPDSAKNEDFWAHSKRTHYHDLVQTGHRAHPTFDKRRQATTFTRYVGSTEESLKVGEEEGKYYFSLEPSFTPALKKRPAPALPVSSDKKKMVVATPYT